MPARPSRRTALIGATGTVAGVVLAGLVAAGLGGPPQGPTPSPVSATVGPLVFFEVLDADGSLLMARPLDGHSLARVVARRPSVDYRQTWSVDPSGHLALAGFDEGGVGRLEGVDTVTGASRWVVDAPTLDLGAGVWSADGTRFAVATQPDDADKRVVVVVDTVAGTIRQVAIPPEPWLQGFDPDGALVMRQRLEDAKGQSTGWRFLRVDPGTGLIGQVAVPPAIGPSSTGGDDVDPAVGIGLDAASREDDPSTDLRAWALAGGRPRIVATFETIDSINLDPSGLVAAIGVGPSLVLTTLDGRSKQIWNGDGRSDIDWSTDGDYLGVVSWSDGATQIDIIERTTGRIVTLPLPTGIAQAGLVRIVGGVSLPDTALPAVEPTPTPTPGPSGLDMPVEAALLAGWIESTEDHSIIHVEQRIPTAQGGLRVASAMDPIDLGETRNLGASGEIGDDGPILTVLPRPGSPEVLVWVDSPAGNHGWLWTPGGERRAFELPTGWPERTSDLTWRPDGLALAAAGFVDGIDGPSQFGFVIGTLGGDTRWLDTPDDYDRLEGWWTADELLVGHGICTEGCPGRYSFSARLSVASETLKQFKTSDHGRVPIHIWYLDNDGRTIYLTAVNEDRANDIRIDWPASIPIDGELEVVGWSADARSLFVTARSVGAATVYRIDDPITRARGGHLADPAPAKVGTLPSGGNVSISRNGQWALDNDRTGATQLVELATGRAWPVDRSATVIWPDGD